jgi:DNA-binding beta-propeller fold protein YncE
MAIDMSIYVLSSTGEVFKYTSGTQDAFELKDMDVPLNAPTKIVIGPKSDALYIADNGNKSVAVVDMEGNFKQRIYHKDKETWNDIKDISISPEDDELFVLNGTSVYEVSL